MSLATTFNLLGEKIIPNIAAKVFPDLMDIIRETTTSDDGGGRKKTTATYLANVPCTYEPFTDKGLKTITGDALNSLVHYRITFPTNQSGTAIAVRPDDRLKVLARGTQAQKVFRIVGIKNDSGVVFEAIAILESGV